MLNLVHATKDAYILWQQSDLVGTYHKRFLATLKFAEALSCIIGQDVATTKIVLEEWGLDTDDPGSITKGKQEAYFS